MPRACFGILGTLEVVRAQEPVELKAMQLRRMLCMLVLSPGRPVPADTLMEWLWPSDVGAGTDARPKDAAATVRVYASRVRRALPGQLARFEEPSGYRLDFERTDVDAYRFESALAAAAPDAASDPHRVASELTGALALWRGPALSEFCDESWAVGAAVRLEELRLVALEMLVDVRLAIGDEALLCGELEHLVEVHPLRERLWSQLMLALYRSGRQAEALRAFQRLRERLAEDLGIAPSPELAAREAAVLRHDPALDRVPDSAARGRPVAPAPALAPEITSSDRDAESLRPVASRDEPAAVNLPAQITRFIGREREVAEVGALLEGFRLVSLTGPGGVGKTRLAVEVASSMHERFADGAFFVDLAPHSGTADVDLAVAAAVGLKPHAGVPAAEVLAESLGTRDLLLVLDNCEHLVGACARVCGALLAACPRLFILATSREPLSVHGEVIYRTLPLGLPAAGQSDPEAIATEESVLLLADRARAQRGSFVVDRSNAGAVVDLCRRLDGIPLAIELAAARLRVLSVREVVDRLDVSFGFLAGGRDRLRPRQQTLGALIDWSYELLESREQTTLLGLAVFAGGFDRQAAEDILRRLGTDGGSALDDLVSLVDKSLVTADTDAGLARFRLLETIRQYALDRLASERGVAAVTALRDAHAAFYLDLAEEGAPLLESAEQFDWLDRLDLERDNLRSALAHLVAREGADRDAMRLVLALGRFFDWRGAENELAGATDALAERGALADLADPIVLQTILARAKLVGRSDPQRAISLIGDLVEQARLVGEDALAAEMLNRLAWLHWSAGRWENARQLHSAAVASARSSGRYLPLVLALNGGGATREERLEALGLSRAKGDGLGAYMALCNLGAIAMDEEDAAAARGYFEEALPIIERAQPGGSDAALLVNLGTALVLDSRHEAARPFYVRGLEAARRHFDDRQAGYGILGLAVCTSLAGGADRAGALHGAAEELFRREGFGVEEAERRMADDDIERIRQKLGEPGLAATLSRGRLLSKEEAIDLALGGA